MSGPSAGQVAEPESARVANGARPTTALTIRQLLQISMFWFALNSIWGGFEVFQQKRVIALVGEDPELALGFMELLVMPIAALAMPVAGSISDYTTSRWGRRKPFIVFGSATTFLAMIGLATSQVFVVLVAFFALLQLTSNIARGPFAGLVPDLVPERQVGIASGLMGLMITFGLMGGYLIVATGYVLDDFTWPMIVLGAIILAATCSPLSWCPPDRRASRVRAGLGEVGLETFGTDMLREQTRLPARVPVLHPRRTAT
jgi:MFS family permease